LSIVFLKNCKEKKLDNLSKFLYNHIAFKIMSFKIIE